MRRTTTRRRWGALALATGLAAGLLPLTAAAAGTTVTVYYKPTAAWTTVNIHYAPNGARGPPCRAWRWTPACTGW